MSAVSPLGAWLESQGIWWPTGDGDILRDAGGAWSAMAALLDDITRTLDAAATTLAGPGTSGASSGAAMDSFTAYWQQWSGTSGYLLTAIDYCDRLAGALTGFASDVDTADRGVVNAVEWAITDSFGLTPPPVPTSPAGAASPVAPAVPAGMSPAALAALRTAAGSIGSSLASAAAAQVQATGVTSIGAIPTAIVNGLVPAQLTHVRWPDPGTAPDFSALASATVDFGAGQGSVLTPTGITTGTTTSTGAGTVTITVDGQTTTVTPTATSAVSVTANGETITVTPATSPGTTIPALTNPAFTNTGLPNPSPSSVPPLPTTAGLTSITSPAYPAGVAAPALALGASIGGGALAAGAVRAAGAIRSAGFGATTVPKMPAIPAIPTAGAPVSVPPPAITPLTSVPAAAVTAAAVKPKAGSSMPFFPMGGMGAGGGGGGEDDDDSRRRRRR